MSGDGDLDKFRKDWVREVENRPTSSNTERIPSSPNCTGFDALQNKEAEGSKLTSSLVVPHVHGSSHPLPSSVISPGKDILDINLEENTPYSFRIASDLLKCDAVEHYSPFRKRKSVEPDGPPESLNTFQKPRKGEQRLLDVLITDLGEITEIAFFDVSLPRELALNIFQHLSFQDLCSCAQVSKSWQNLADDELLWREVCKNTLQLVNEDSTADEPAENWKKYARDCVVKRRRLRTNWKQRIGRVSVLSYAQGGVIACAAGAGTNVVTGYTNGNVKLWDLSSGDECVFSPSNSSLLIDGSVEFGTLSNYPISVDTNSQFTVAAFSQGIVNVWNNDEGVLRASSSHSGPVTRVRLCTHHGVVCTQNSNLVTLETFHHSRFHPLAAISGQGKILCTNLWDSPSSIHLVFATPASLRLCLVDDIPDIAGTEASYVKGNSDICSETAPIPLPFTPSIAIEEFVCRTIKTLERDETHFLAGVTNYTNLCAEFKVQAYDIASLKPDFALRGHTSHVSCISRASHQTLATGCVDRKVRTFDKRCPLEAVGTFAGHQAEVTQVQVDDWKVVSGAKDGLVCVWDQRMTASKLWELYNRHPVELCYFTDDLLVTANIPANKFPEDCDEQAMFHLRFRGTLQAYDFDLSSDSPNSVPDICHSNYSEPSGYNYNISLATPYDNI